MQELLAEEEQAHAKAAAKQAKKRAKQRQYQTTAIPPSSDSYDLPPASQLVPSRHNNAPASEPQLDADTGEEYSGVPTPLTMADVVVAADFQPATPMSTGMCTGRSTAVSPMAKHMPDLYQPVCISPALHDLATAASTSGIVTDGSPSVGPSGSYKSTWGCRQAPDHSCKTVTSDLTMQGSAASKQELQLLLSCPLTKVQH